MGTYCLTYYTTCNILNNVRPVRLIHLHAGAMFVHILERSECVRDREEERRERRSDREDVLFSR